MNKYLISASIIVCIICLQSCQPNKVDSATSVQALSLDTSISTDKVVKLEDELSIVNPFRIVNVNDQYLVISEQRSDNFFNIFKLPEAEYLYSWGKQGRGPGADEFYSLPMYLNTHQDQLILFDGLAQRLKYVTITDTAAVKMDEKRLSYEGQMDPLNRIRLIKDDLFFADYGSSFEDTDREHVALRPGVNDTLFAFGKYPESEWTDIERYHKFLKENLAKPDGSRFAAFYFRYNRFKIYNDRGEEIKDVKIHDPYLDDSSANTEDSFLYSVPAHASNSFIYLLGLYAPREKIYGDPGPDLKTSLEIWNWEGEPVWRTEFDRLIGNFTVSEKHGFIYAYPIPFDGALYLYELPDVN